MDWFTNATDFFQTKLEGQNSSNSFQLLNKSITIKSNVDNMISNFTPSCMNSTDCLSLENINSNETLRNIYPALSLYNDVVDPKYLERINIFWLKFNPPSPRTHYIISCIYIIMATIGCFGNALVIYMFIRCKSLRTPSNVLVINLAISDFFMLAKCPIAIYNSIKLGPALGDWGCRLYGLIGGLTGTVSIITLTAISIDRYNVVVYPLDNERSITKLRSMLCFIWLYSLFFSSIPALDIGLSEYVPEGLLTTCSFDYLSKSIKARIFMFIFFLGAWLLPFITITYCYFYILKVVTNANKIQSSKDKTKTEIKLSIIVIGVIILWFLAWTPYSIVALLGITGNEKYLTPLASMIPAIFCKTSACIDPYIYAITHPRFRMEFRRIFFKQTMKMRRRSTYRTSISRVSTSRHNIIRDSINLKEFHRKENNNKNIIGKITIISATIEQEEEKPTLSEQQTIEKNNETIFLSTENV